MNRILSRALLILFVLAATGILTGGMAPTPGASPSGSIQAQVEIPTYCLFERNHGACVDCCKEALRALIDIPGNVCARYCNTLKFPVPPPPEPQP